MAGFTMSTAIVIKLQLDQLDLAEKCGRLAEEKRPDIKELLKDSSDIPG